MTVKTEKLRKCNDKAKNKNFSLLEEGSAPVVLIDGFNQFSSFLQSPFFRKTHEENHVFRGQENGMWQLRSSLDRIVINDFLEQRNKQLENFRKFVRGRIINIENYEKTDNELWAVGQHFALKTPLLDWTRSIYVALFFAFSTNDGKTKEYRTIYALNREKIEKLFPENSPQERAKLERILTFFEPVRDDYGRLVNQSGLFTVQNMDGDLEKHIVSLIASKLESYSRGREEEKVKKLLPYFYKIYFRDTERKNYILQLQTMNIHHGSLFPDVLGASEYCNLLMQDQLERKLEKEKKSEIYQAVRKVLAHKRASSPQLKNKLKPVGLLTSMIVKIIEENSVEAYMNKIVSGIIELLTKNQWPKEFHEEIVDSIKTIISEKTEKYEKYKVGW